MDGVQFKCGVVEPPGLCGATGDEKPADAEIQALCDLVRDDFLAQSGITVSQFVAVSFATQVVNGYNHFVKVDVGDGRFCHLRIYEPRAHTKQKPSLHAFQVNKSKLDLIGFF
ncbi:cystatin-B-like [Leptodactylus fuscus]|uniref:cystatin-B-like n=1 Tax=Leptodactylus fuscus TaxID=238119 RepID=UPI003F4E4DC1